jgi:hypothetical protein
MHEESSSLLHFRLEPYSGAKVAATAAESGLVHQAHLTLASRVHPAPCRVCCC